MLNRLLILTCNGATYFVKTLYDNFSQIIELYKSLKYATVELDAGKREEIQQKRRKYLLIFFDFPGLRHDIASYIIPEIEELMSSITNFGLGIQDVHQKVNTS